MKLQELLHSFGLPPPLVRKHALKTELKSVVQRLHFMSDEGHDEPSKFHPLAPKSKGLLKHFTKTYISHHQGSKYRGIKDKRFVLGDFSEAAYIVQLSLPDEEQADELKAAFSQEERDALRKLLLPLRDARTELENNGGVFTKDMVKSVKSAAKIGMDWIEARATIIVTTASAGQQNRFVMMRQAHAILIEEATRLSDGYM
jgi:hypothetical protein